MRTEKRGDEGGERCQRSMRQMDVEGDRRSRYNMTFEVSLPTDPVVSSPRRSNMFSFQPKMFKVFENLCFSFILGS